MDDREKQWAVDMNVVTNVTLDIDSNIKLHILISRKLYVTHSYCLFIVHGPYSANGESIVSMNAINKPKYRDTIFSAR